MLLRNFFFSNFLTEDWEGVALESCTNLNMFCVGISGN